MKIRFLVVSFLTIAPILLGTLGCDTSGNLVHTEDRYFVKYYGEDGDQTAVDILPNADGTIMILAKSSVGDERILLVNVDSRGNIKWQKKFGEITDEPRDIQPTSNGYVVLSEYKKSEGNIDLKLIHISKDGSEIKTSTHGSPYNDHANSLTPLDDGGFIIAGYSDFDWSPSDDVERLSSILHYRCDANLVFQSSDWPDNFGSGSINVATKVVQTLDSIYVFGYTNAVSYQNPNNKNVLFYYSIGSTGPTDAPNYLGDINKNTQSSFVFKTSSELIDGFFLLSTMDYETATPKLRVSKLFDPLKFKNVDDIQFDRTIDEGSFANRNLVGVSATQSLTIPEGYLLASNETNITGQTNVLLTKINQEGKEVWSVDYGSSKNDKAASVVELPDGKILILMTVQLDIQLKIALLKVNSRGQFAN